uniref:Ig-like domain-containing protein n=1 Tax=Oreochromis niloticus TaxID=8128 RepID=A0A669DGI4_ORENI
QCLIMRGCFLSHIMFTYYQRVCVCVCVCVSEVGQDVTLTCRAPNNNPISVLKWSRADRVGDEYLLLYKNKRFEPDDQHPSFKNRVDLQDRQMKDGDVSLILKNVTINDTGTYECRVTQREPNQERPSLKHISIIYLHVDPPGEQSSVFQPEHTKDGEKKDIPAIKSLSPYEDMV